ncbi:alanine dehydrogenase [Reticulomyxa filosa]|uniref:Alanine dehydrogenase n=1 Tax=Reticulomyxa filosa TaxID=46433 RepID=X6ND87_RETFI|nr:alanine dehydrogenase [Reticulomyxa filosa]|eukprot:ETO23853.1 alanine dehydrogenase [Reticulomyxa filosa]
MHILHRPSMREIDTETVKRTNLLIVDSDEAFHSGDLESCQKIVKFVKNDNYVLLSEVVGKNSHKLDSKKLGHPLDPKHEKQITLFESVGVSAQDLFSAIAIYENALKQNVGTELVLA